MRHLFLAAAFGMAVAACTPALAGTDRQATYGQVMQPAAHTAFCIHNPGECDVVPGSSDMSEATRRGIIHTVNALVNQMVHPQHEGTNAKGENLNVWQYPTNRSGDCEDFALLKQKLLRERGFASADLLLSVVRTDTGGHVVLVVRMADGDYVLDNLRPEVRLWDAEVYSSGKRRARARGRYRKWVRYTIKETSYTWVKRQSSTDPAIWERLK
ncbi:MAG: transglutaminase-like cysteine peptidase [Rhodobacteraceae bacterium]|nr:transglutaminase-like cysteine peptidase [Paracoccaceae bacterium]